MVVSELGELMHRRLLHDARELGATTLAFVEYADDAQFFDFLRERGSCGWEGGINGFAIIRMERKLSP